MPNLPEQHNAHKVRRTRTASVKARQGKRAYATYSRRWRADRKQQLDTQPLCEHCLAYGRYTPANEVDHINGSASNEADYTPDNYQSLCKSCHSKKTVTQ